MRAPAARAYPPLDVEAVAAEIEPVSLADFQRFLFAWQGLGAERREGLEALGAVLDELAGAVLPAAVWEREVIPARIVGYEPALIDELSESGAVVWWRPCPSATAGPRPTTVAASLIGIVPRTQLASWRLLAERVRSAEPERFSEPAARVARALTEGGALFFVEILERSSLLRVQVEEALSELVARGVVTADAFRGLRALLTPQRKRPGFDHRRRRRHRGSRFDAAGRWSLLPPPAGARDPRVCDEAVELAARALLKRYGIVARAVAAREPLAPSWRELSGLYRRWEARGEIRGGRFVAPLAGEQFALPEAVERLRC